MAVDAGTPCLPLSAKPPENDGTAIYVTIDVLLHTSPNPSAAPPPASTDSPSLSASSASFLPKDCVRDLRDLHVYLSDDGRRLLLFASTSGKRAEVDLIRPLVGAGDVPRGREDQGGEGPVDTGVVGGVWKGRVEAKYRSHKTRIELTLR